jgi:tRNA threonylcarbamoyladenosine modification (KEOPS) complex Cgi121 subunit
MLSKTLNGKKCFISIGKADINNVEELIKNISLSKKGAGALIFQGFSLKPIASIHQVLSAADSSINAFNEGFEITKSIDLELLLRLSGIRQVNKALDLIGLKQGKQEACFIAVSETKNANKTRQALTSFLKSIAFKEVPGLLEKNLKANSRFLQEFYGITEKELKALKDLGSTEIALKELILEKAALINV